MTVVYESPEGNRHDMTRDKSLKSCLDKLAAEYDASFLDSDPLGIVHDYTDPADRETAGLIVSALSYGGAAQIRKSARAALVPAGESPADFARSVTVNEASALFRSFKHRWTTGDDVAFLYLAAGAMSRDFGTIGVFMKSLDDPSLPTIETLMIRFSNWMRTFRESLPEGNSGPRDPSYLIPSPAQGSACKRLAMYFRWMVRGPDALDFGLWPFIGTSRLIIPVDRHIARMSQCLGLTKRHSADWTMAREITDSLARLDSGDPLRYDFALVRPGILRECTSRASGNCKECVLRSVCGRAV